MEDKPKNIPSVPEPDGKTENTKTPHPSQLAKPKSRYGRDSAIPKKSTDDDDKDAHS
jgi:hypothetical protein